MKTETVTVELVAGGSVQLIVNVDFLTVGEDDFRFVRGLVDRMRGYSDTPDTEPATTLPPLPSTPSPAAKAKRGRPKGPSKLPPLTEIAAVINTARAEGRATGAAISEAFGVFDSTARNWIARARKAGLVDDNVTAITSAPSASKVKGPTQLGGRRPSVDYAAVAACMIELRDAGLSVQDGITKKYGVSVSQAKNWMARCREMGLVPKSVAGLKVIEDNTITATTAVYDGPAVAAAYLEATRAGVRPVQNVADHFGIDRTVAAEWIRLARNSGLLRPANEPQLPDGERREMLNAYKPEALA